MKQPYFIVVLAHSLHGRLRSVRIQHNVIYLVLGLTVVLLLGVAGLLSSYVRMTWKVADYNALRREAESLRARYRELQKAYNQTNQQLASLQLFASEVLTAYGIRRRLEEPADISKESGLVPTYRETLEEYNFLRTASLARFHRAYTQVWRTNMRPSIWPVDGRLIGAFGDRSDPFSGAQSFHTGVDISGPYGAPVRATADGVVVHADYSGGYGRLVIIDHGGGVQTYYAHLSRFDVIPGQEIRRGEVVGALGGSGRVTAPHLHYEVRVAGNPVNPYRFLARASYASAPRTDFPF
ncbi:MAG TPA: M23 family metallopeptidase [Bryobacteraceae bacterium]|nr:M23 family metallopeptidase [Bryobacteraceae bacterium]